MTKRKRTILVVLCFVVILGGWGYYHHYYTGSRSGTVVDAVSGGPIAGAVVCMQWFTGGFMGVVGGSGAAYYETVTDERGRYEIPSLRLSRKNWFEGVYDEDVLIYKNGYSGYMVYGDGLRPVGQTFASGAAEQPYHKKRNLVRLFPFKISDSHRDHLNWIQIFGIYNWPKQLLEKELQKEMERARAE